MKSLKLIAFALTALMAAACVEDIPEKDPCGTLSITLSSAIGDVHVTDLRISDGNNLLLQTDKAVDVTAAGSTLEFKVDEGTYENVTISIATDDNRTGLFTLKSGAGLAVNAGASTFCPIKITSLKDNSAAEESFLPSGRMFNMAVKAMVRQKPDSLHCTYSMVDSIIKSITFVNESPATDGVRIDNFDGAPAYAYYDKGNGAITISTSAKKFRLNEYPAFMFDHLETLESIDFGNMTAPEVYKLEYMFSYCRKLKALDLKFIENTSKCTSMDNLFSYCGSLESVDVSHFNTESVEHMRSMFNHCTSLKAVDVSNFNTANCKNITYMFYYASSLETLDLSGFTVNQMVATKMNYLFYGLSSLKELRLAKGFCPSDLGSPTCCFASNSLVYEDRIGSKAGGLTIYSDQATADWLVTTTLRWINSGYKNIKAIPVTFKNMDSNEPLTVTWAKN